jgi:hypothetical protein
MADEEDWCKPNRAPRPPRQPTPGELLFEFHVAATHAFWWVEVRDHGAYGIEAQCLDPVDIRIARTFRQANVKEPTTDGRLAARSSAFVNCSTRSVPHAQSFAPTEPEHV